MRIIKFALALVGALLANPAVAANNPAAIPAISTISALKSIGAASPQYPIVQVMGYNTPGDGGGGTFYWSPASTATTDLCVTFQATGVTTGRWIRQFGDDLYVEYCGAYHDGTHATQTQAALQAASDYAQSLSAVANGSSPVIRFVSGTYNCGTGSSCVKSTLVSGCPNFAGAGSAGNSPGSSLISNPNTTIQYSPAAETAAFEFHGLNGLCQGGGVSNVRVTGNGNTVGCKFFSVGGGHCAIYAGVLKKVAINCSCDSGGFVENNIYTLNVPDASSVSGAALEYLTTGGGNGSMRGSGLGQGSYISHPSSGGTDILIDSGSQVYSAPLWLSENNQGGSTVYVIDNESANLATFFGNLQIESDASGSIVQISKVSTNTNSIGGSVQVQIANSGALVQGPTVYSGQAGTNGGQNTYSSAYYKLEDATGFRQFLAAGTNATTTLAEVISPNSSRTYDLLIFGSEYKWNGQVQVLTDSGGSNFTAVQISGHRYVGTNDPVFAVSGGQLTITIADTITASTNEIQGVVSIAGEGEN